MKVRIKKVPKAQVGKKYKPNYFEGIDNSQDYLMDNSQTISQPQEYTINPWDYQDINLNSKVNGNNTMLPQGKVNSSDLYSAVKNYTYNNHPENTLMQGSDPFKPMQLTPIQGNQATPKPFSNPQQKPFYWNANLNQQEPQDDIYGDIAKGNTFITGTKNKQGQQVGGTGAKSTTGNTPSPNPKKKRDGNLSGLITAGLGIVDSFIPNSKINSNQPKGSQVYETYNTPMYGYGSQAIAKNGLMMHGDKNMMDIQKYDQGGITPLWGGDVQPISYNPVDGQTTYMADGNTHEQSDGHGNTGVGIQTREGNRVEVEGGGQSQGEPIIRNPNGDTNVGGNMYLPGTKIKYKKVLTKIAEGENKYANILDESSNNIQEKPNTTYDIFSNNTNILNVLGSRKKLETLSAKKNDIIAYQNAVLDTAKEHGIKPEHLSLGKIKKDKSSNKAQFGMGIGPLKTGMHSQAFYMDTGTPQPRLQDNVQNYDLVSNSPEGRMVDYNTGQNQIQSMAKYGMNITKAQPGVEIKPYTGDNTVSIDPTTKLPSKTWNKSKYSQQEWTDIKNKLGYSGKENNTEFQKYLSNKFPEIVDYYHSNKSYGLPKAGTKYDGKLGVRWDAIAEKALGVQPLPQQKAPSLAIDPAPQVTPKAQAPMQTFNNYQHLPPQQQKPILPSSAKPLSINQLYPEIYAAATNQVEPVPMQKYQPILDQPYKISLQDQRNSDYSNYRGMQQLLWDNPEALSVLAGQERLSEHSSLGEEFRTNQGIEAGVINKNNNTLNNAQLQNNQYADIQGQRQSQARSNTKKEWNNIITSVSDKYNLNRLEQQDIKLKENLFEYRLQPDGTYKYIYMGGAKDPTATPDSVPNTDTVEETMDPRTGEVTSRKTTKKVVTTKENGGKINFAQAVKRAPKTKNYQY